MICGLSCGFVGRGSEQLLDWGAPVLPLADSCMWHGCGTNLSRREPVTMAGAPTDQTRVCLAAPPRAPTTLSVRLTRTSLDGRHVMTVLRPSLRGGQVVRWHTNSGFVEHPRQTARIT